VLNAAVRLHLNEMPYPPPDDVVQAAREGLYDLNRYTAGEESSLRSLLAEYVEVPEDSVFVGPGSEPLLREMIQSFAPQRKVIMVSPSFFPTAGAARETAARFVSIRLKLPDFSLPVPVLLDEPDGPSLVIIDSPNNPTGKLLLERRTVEALLKHRQTIVVIDEAYAEFSGESLVDLTREHANLAVARTMDKAFSLAGIRIGYVVAGAVFARPLSRLSMFLPRPSLRVAVEALKDRGYVEKNIAAVLEERRRVAAGLSSLGADVLPSSTNFLFVRAALPDMAARLGENGVMVADLSHQMPPGCIRVSIGTPEENHAFLNAYRSILEASSTASSDPAGTHGGSGETH